jgi:hypothetical protein
MAGGLLALGGGRFAAGTRQGLLAVVNTTAMLCEARVKVSDQEAFLSPVRVFDGRIAVGTREGVVSFWRLEAGRLQACGTARLDAAVDDLAACPCGSRLFALSGGSLRQWDRAGRGSARVGAGHDARDWRLAARILACVATGPWCA